MLTETYVRKSFSVDAIKVTDTNMTEVAKWCQGEIKVDEKNQSYILVRVHNPLNDRQKKAYSGDHVLYAGKGYKVYTGKAFERSFERMEPTTEPRNVFINQHVIGDEISGVAVKPGPNPGGTKNVG